MYDYKKILDSFLLRALLFGAFFYLNLLFNYGALRSSQSQYYFGLLAVCLFL